MTTDTTPSAKPAPLVVPTNTGPIGEAAASEVSGIVNAIIYGVSGAGKTMFCGTAEDDPRTAPVLFLDTERGSMTIDYRSKGLHIIHITQENCAETLNRITQGIEQGKAIFKRPGSPYDGMPYKTIVVDTLTGASAKIIDSLVGKRGIDARAEGNDWGIFNTVMLRLVTRFRDAGLNVIMTAHEREYPNTIGPFIEGQKVPQALPAHFDIVSRLFLKEQSAPSGKGVVFARVLQFQPDGKYTIKDRSDRFGTLPPTMDSPTVTKLLDRIEAGRAAALAKSQS